MPTDLQFIGCILDPRDLVEIRFLPNRSSRFVRVSEMATLDADLESLNAREQNIYIGANPRRHDQGKKDRDVAVARCLFVDIDNAVSIEDGRTRIDGAGLPKPTCTVSSGHGLHAYWRLVEPMEDLAAWSAAQQHLIAILNSDKVIHNPSRIMRLPQFINHKRENPVPCEVLDADPGRSYMLSQLMPDGVNVAETQSSRSHVSAVSANSATPEQIIGMTLPKNQGERNARLHDLARGLKFDVELRDHPLSEVRPIVRKWHDRAKPVIRTKDWPTTWADFLRAWETCAIPLKCDPVKEAFAAASRQVRDGSLPNAAAEYEGSEPVQLLVVACANLARLRANRRFFLSCHDAAKCLDDMAPAQAWRFLRMLCADGVLEKVKPGNQRSATRYRWTGGLI
jgi:hypothetical protein